MANTGCAGSAIDVAPICLNFGITAPVLSWVITWRGRIEIKSPARTTAPFGSPSACRAAIFSTNVSPIPNSTFEKLLPGCALAKELGDVEVDEIGVMKND